MDQPTILNPSPRAKYRANKELVRAHRELMQNPNLLDALDEAFLEYVLTSTQSSKDGNMAAANQFKLCGVQEFIQLFKTFAEPQAELTKRTPTNDNLAQPQSALR